MKNDRSLTCRYPAYKDSENEWLGKIPKDWKNKRLKDIAKIIDCKNRTPDYFDDGKYLVIRTSNVRGGKIVLDNPSFTNESNFLEWTKRGVPPTGSILFTREAPAGEVCLVPTEYKSCLGQRMMNFIPNEKGYSIYLLYYILSHSVKCYLDSITSGSTVHHLRVPQVFDLPVIAPPLLEQKAIGHYLDTKTAQIDRKIDLLTQKATLYGNLKQSLINETVTRGLDKSVVMKDSSIEWIGKVPEPWTFNRHKDNFEFITKRCEDTSLVKVGLENIEGKTGKYLLTESDFDGNGIEFIKSDILFGKLRPYLSKVYLAEFKGSAIGDIFVYRPIINMIPKFASYLMLSSKYIDVINSSTSGAKMPRANMSFIANLPVITPPIVEQEAIADYLDTKTAKIDQITQTINTQIEKLRELRKTLINDVVTGKIKVT